MAESPSNLAIPITRSPSQTENVHKLYSKAALICSIGGASHPTDVNLSLIHIFVEYVFNVPWNMKCPNGIVKGLLRHAGERYLPGEILWRKKSPYPKTYDPAYEKLLGDRLKEVLADPNAPIRQLLDTRKVHTFLESPSDYGKPFYGPVSYTHLDVYKRQS